MITAVVVASSLATISEFLSLYEKIHFKVKRHEKLFSAFGKLLRLFFEIKHFFLISVNAIFTL